MVDSLLEAKVILSLDESEKTIRELANELEVTQKSVRDILNSNPGFVQSAEQKWHIDFNQYDIKLETKELTILEDVISGFSAGKSTYFIVPGKNPIIVENATPRKFEIDQLIRRLTNNADFPYFLAVLERAHKRAETYEERHRSLVMEGVWLEVAKILPAIQSLNYLVTYLLNDPRRGTPEEWAILLNKPKD